MVHYWLCFASFFVLRKVIPSRIAGANRISEQLSTWGTEVEIVRIDNLPRMVVPTPRYRAWALVPQTLSHT